MAFRPHTVAFCFIVAAGCSKAATPPADMASLGINNFAQINEAIFQPTCTTSTCHSDSNANSANKLSLCSAPKGGAQGTTLCATTTTLSDAYANLVNRPSVNALAHDMGLLRVKPCDPDHSFLVTKLTLPESDVDGGVGFGAHMPGSGNPSLLAPQLSAIRDWISRGAYLDEPADVSGTTCTLAPDMSAATPVDLSTLD